MSHHRTHKSTKVPNVKLRPVAKTHSTSSHLDDLSLNRTLEAQYAERDLQNDRRSKKRRIDPHSAEHDEDREHDDDPDNDNFPLRGTFFCFTGVGEEKVRIHADATHAPRMTLIFFFTTFADEVSSSSYKSRCNCRRRSH